MKLQPQIFLGQVMHRRVRPTHHGFVYPVFYVQLPVRDLAAAACAFFSLERRNLLSFHNKDHGPRDGSPLLPWIERLLVAHGLPSDGPILLQTFPRILGYVFNPVSFWFCHDRAGQLMAVLAEVNNTFGGTHSYLLHHGGAPLADGETLEAAKCLHVSPFNTVDGSYQFRFQRAGALQRACIDYHNAEGEVLRSALSGTAQAWSARALLTMFLRMPLLTLGVYARIHWQALQLWRKGVPFHGAQPASSSPRQKPDL